MNDKVKVNGLTFVPFLKHDAIEREVERVAAEISADLGEDSEPVFLCVLTGAFIFAADLVRRVKVKSCSTAFVRYASYEGTESTGTVRKLTGITENLTGKDVVIVEDIVDTGRTAQVMIDDIMQQNPRSVKFATLLYKPESSKTGFKPDYHAFAIPPKFIIGYGLDIDGKMRNLSDIYVIEED